MMELEAVRGGTDSVLRSGCLLLEKVKYRETSWWRKKQVYSECRHSGRMADPSKGHLPIARTGRRFYRDTGRTKERGNQLGRSES